MWYSIISDQLTYSHIQYNYHINSCQVYEPYWYVIHLDHGYGYDKDQTFSSERLATLQGDPRDPRTTDGWVFNQMSFDSWSLRTPIVIFWMVFGWNLQGFFGCILELELAFLVVFGWFLGAFCPSLAKISEGSRKKWRQSSPVSTGRRHLRLASALAQPAQTAANMECSLATTCPFLAAYVCSECMYLIVYVYVFIYHYYILLQRILYMELNTFSCTRTHAQT